MTREHPLRHLIRLPLEHVTRRPDRQTTSRRSSAFPTPVAARTMTLQPRHRIHPRLGRTPQHTPRHSRSPRGVPGFRLLDRECGVHPFTSRP
jgi:hypothetical protein